MTDHIYFTLLPNTPAAARMKEFQDSITAHRDAVRKFAKKYKLTKAGWIGDNRKLVLGFSPPKDMQWHEFLEKYPLLRRTKGRGCDWAVPRRVGVEAKAMRADWNARPDVHNIDGLQRDFFGLDKFMDWMQGMGRHSIGFQTGAKDTWLVAVPFFATKNKKFKLLEGLVKTKDQEAAMEAWNAKDRG